jgi:DNA topoisomerase I
MGEKKSLVIVESPAKAKTIAKYLGSGFQVEASIGHIRDLPGGAKEVPAEFKGQPWASLGVNVDEGFEPLYVIPSDKKKHITFLKSALKDAKDLYLATDEDREGRSDFVAFARSPWLQSPSPSDGFPRNHQRSDPNGARKYSADRRGAGPSSGNATRSRSLVRFDVSPLLWKKVDRNCRLAVCRASQFG